MTTAQLIDYLSQFPPTTLVVLAEKDAPEDTEDFIVLDYIDFNPEE